MLRRILIYDEGEETPNITLFEAAYGGLDKVVKMLLEKGEDPNIRDENGWSPLIYAAYAGHFFTVKALLDSGADRCEEKNCCEAIFWAHEKGHSGIEALLRLATGLEHS